MRLYAIRHADAGDYIGKSQADEFIHNPEDLARSLLPEGVEMAQNLAQWMLAQDEVPTLILCSPIKRALQTAQVLRAGLISGGAKVKLRPEQNLEIAKPWEMTVKALASDPKAKRVALVSHRDNMEPGLRALNYYAGPDKFIVDPIAKCELRVLKVDRSAFTWKERARVMPSDLGSYDSY
jgi:phosphohistidine phosphatase SixA